MKENEWLEDIIEAVNQLGGEAHYTDLYPTVKIIRENRGSKIYPSFNAVIRRTIQEHSKETKSYKYHDVFYSVNGLGKGTWGLLPKYRKLDVSTEAIKNIRNESKNPAYKDGIEGIQREGRYIRRSRNPRLVEDRKSKDNYTCQACGYRKEISNSKYIIDVHHINPLGTTQEATLTSIEDIICLCPNCHRIAHTRKRKPLSISEIKSILEDKKL